MGTGVMYLEGKYDAAAKTITYLGTSVDPMSGKDMKVRETITFIDDNNSAMDMYVIEGGKEVKTMHIDSVRK